MVLDIPNATCFATARKQLNRNKADSTLSTQPMVHKSQERLDPFLGGGAGTRILPRDGRSLPGAI